MIFPKKDGEIPTNPGYIAVSVSYVSELIANNYTQFMQFNNPDTPAVRDVAMVTDTLFDGSKRWRWEVRSRAPYTPTARGDTFLEVYEIFSANTLARLYGMTTGYRPVTTDTVYYTQVVDVSMWSMAPATTGIGIVNQWVLNIKPGTQNIIGYNATNVISVDTKSPVMNLVSSQSLRPVVDGVIGSATWNGFVTTTSNGALLVFNSNTTMARPNTRLSVEYEFVISPGSSSSITAAIEPSLPGYKKSAIAVAVVFGVPAVFLIIGFATFFFCLGAWLPFWAVISRPGRFVYRKIYDWRRPPAPRFRADDDDEEDDDEHDPLHSERVGADDILKMTGGAVGSAAAGKLDKHHGRQSSQDNVLIRLRKAMGRRLSNFVGWDGPDGTAPGIAASGSEKASSSKKNKNKNKSTPLDSSQMTEDEDTEASSASYYAQPSNAHEESGLMGGDSDDGAPAHLQLGYSSGEDNDQSGQYSPTSSPSSSRPETPVRMRPEARTEETSPSRGKRGAAHATGLRGFKITSSPVVSIDHPSPPPSAHPVALDSPLTSPTGSSSAPNSPEQER